MFPTKNATVSCPPTGKELARPALQPPQMYFSPSEYTKPFKISAKCYIHKAVALLESHLKDKELKWFRDHPQFRHFFHMHRDPNHKLMGMWLLFLRTARLKKKREVWFIVNGVPIRYSLKEFAIMSGLHCHQYPKSYANKGSNEFVSKYFGQGTKIQYPDVEEKLLSMKKPSNDRLRMAVLYFLCNIIVGKGKTGENAPSVEKFFLRAVADLELCKTFPWGRYAYDENIKDIFYLLEKSGGVVGPQKVFPSFVIPLEFLAFEAIPVLRNSFCDVVQSADPKCPRMCKIKFKPSPKKSFPMSDVYEKLGTTNDIQSILTPSPDEKVLLERIIDDEECVADVDGWKKRLVDEERTICFEEHYSKDVASRAIEANMITDTVIMAPKKVCRGKRKVAPKNVSNDGLAELVYQLKTVLENGFKDINEKIEEQDTRLKIMEASIRLSTKIDGGNGDKENEGVAKELETVGSDVDGGDKESEVGEEVMEMEMEKEVTQDDEMETEIGKDDEPSNKEKMLKRKRGKEEDPKEQGEKMVRCVVVNHLEDVNEGGVQPTNFSYSRAVNTSAHTSLPNNPTGQSPRLHLPLISDLWDYELEKLSKEQETLRKFFEETTSELKAELERKVAEARGEYDRKSQEVYTEYNANAKKIEEAFRSLVDMNSLLPKSSCSVKSAVTDTAAVRVRSSQHSRQQQKAVQTNTNMNSTAPTRPSVTTARQVQQQQQGNSNSSLVYLSDDD